MILLFGLIWLCKKLRWEKAVYVSRFAHGGDTFPLGTTSLLEESSGLQKAYSNACPKFGQNIYRSMLVPCHETMASFMIFRRVLDLHEIKKSSFSIFPVEPRRPDVWISFPFLAWDLEIHPRTHMWFFNQLWCTGACAFSSNLNYAR